MATQRSIPPEFAAVADVQKNMQTDVENLQKRVGTNEHFAQTFKDASQGQKAIDEAIEATIVRLLEHDTDTQSAVEVLVGKIDGRETNKQLWGLGKIALWIVSLLITAGATAWITVVVTNANTPKTTQSSEHKTA
jgi:hypothetical protein